LFVGHDLYKKEVAKCSEWSFIIFAAVQALKTAVRGSARSCYPISALSRAEVSTWPGKLCVKMEHMAENKDLYEAVHVRDMKEYEEVEIHFHSFLTSVLDGRKWSASRSGPLNPEKFPLEPIEWKAGWTQSRSGPF
jgi:hypothetical protein